MSRALKTLERSEVPASITLTSNAEQLAWKIHQLSVAVADREPSAVSHGLRRLATAEWRRTYLDLPE